MNNTNDESVQPDYAIPISLISLKNGKITLACAIKMQVYVTLFVNIKFITITHNSKSILFILVVQYQFNYKTNYVNKVYYTQQQKQGVVDIM